jgi:hypothetical protein
MRCPARLAPDGVEIWRPAGRFATFTIIRVTDNMLNAGVILKIVCYTGIPKEKRFLEMPVYRLTEGCGFTL